MRSPALLDDAEGRAARALDPADADRPRRRRRLRPPRARAAGRAARRAGRTTAAARAARCSSRAWTSPAGASRRDRREAVVGEPGRVGARRPRRARWPAPQGRRRRARARRSAVTTPMSGSRSWNEALKSELAPAALRARARDRGELVARGRDLRRRRASSALPPTLDGAEQEAVAGERCVQPPRALGERGEAACSRRRGRRRRRRRRCR